MSKKLDSFYEDRYIYMNGYFEGKKDTEKRIIMTMYKNKATIKCISMYIRMSEDIVQEIIKECKSES